MGFLKPNTKKQNIQQKIGSLPMYVLLLLFIVMGLSLVRNIYRAKAAREQIMAAKNQLTELQHTKDLLKNELEMIQSHEYLDKEAHDKLNLVHEGEAVLVLPEEDVLRRLSPRTEVHEDEMRPLTNWQAWLKLFL